MSALPGASKLVELARSLLWTLPVLSWMQLFCFQVSLLLTQALGFQESGAVLIVHLWLPFLGCWQKQS